MMHRLHRFILLAAFATPLVAQTETARFLVPIVATNVPGAFGSTWKSELVVFNNGSAIFPLTYYQFPCLGNCPNGIGLVPQRAIDITDLGRLGSAPAALVYVPAASRDSVEFGLRVRDLSQQANSYGTEIPVVPDERTFAHAFDLLNVPLTARFRQMLRVYDVAATGPSTVTVQYITMDNDADRVLLEQQIALELTGAQPPLRLSPGYAEVGQLASLPGLAAADRVRIRITPTSSTQRLWAFVSVTNNDTQELTIVSP